MCTRTWRLCVIYYEFCTKEIRPETSNIFYGLASLKKTAFRVDSSKITDSNL